MFDLNRIDVENNDFWVKNRRYIQQDRFIKYNLFKRLELWLQINEQLTYDDLLSKNIAVLDSVIRGKKTSGRLFEGGGETKLATSFPEIRRRNPRTRNRQLTSKV